MTTRTPARTLAVAAATVLTAAVLTACSHDSSSAASSTTATTGATATASTTVRTTPRTTAAGSGGTDGSGIAVGEPTPGDGSGGTGGGSGSGGGDTGGSGGGDTGGSGGGDTGGSGGGTVDERCTTDALAQAYGGTLTQVGSVAYCDGDWAVSGNSPSYLNQPFMHRDHGWVVFDADSANPGIGHECYTSAYLDQIGAPDAVRANLVTCYVAPDTTVPAAPASPTVPVTPPQE